MKARERVRLGRTALEVTRLGLGTAPLGGLYEAVEERVALEVVGAAWQADLRFFDTAPLYGHGLSERRVGRALRDKSRTEYTLATKVGRLLRADAPPEPGQLFRGVPAVNPVFDFSSDGVMRSLYESLERLGLERVDIAHIHGPINYFKQALNEAYPALDRLRTEGVIAAVGVGMTQAEMLVRFAHEADFDCFLLAGRYTLLDQVALQDLLPLCSERRIGVVIGGVFNSGILADPHPGAYYDYRPASRVHLERAQSLASVCSRYRVPLKAAALQFPFGHPAVASVLVGCRSVDELGENIRLFEEPIPPALWEEMKSEGLLGEEVPTP